MLSQKDQISQLKFAKSFKQLNAYWTSNFAYIDSKMFLSFWSGGIKLISFNYKIIQFNSFEWSFFHTNIKIAC